MKRLGVSRLLCSLGTALVFGLSWGAPASGVNAKSARAAPPAAAVQAAAQAASAAEADTARDVSLEIKIDTSRVQPYAGSGLGITAELKNKSKKTVLYLSDRTTTLTLPPEMEGPFAPMYGREAFFPSENDQWRANQARSEAEKRPVLITIQPGQSYRAVWVQNVESETAQASGADAAAQQANRASKAGLLWFRCPDQAGASLPCDAWRQVRSELRYIFFTPGDYKVLVQAKVGANKLPSDEGHYTFSEVATIKVAAPQFVIIFGAMIGGLISWLLFPQGEEKAVSLEFSAAGVWVFAKKVWWYLYSIAGACLLSAIVTILMARLSESQFLVKISVTDFWGALVVGFIAQYAGKSVLDKLIPGRPGSQTPSPQKQTQAAAAPQPPAGSPAAPSAPVMASLQLPPPPTP